MLLKLRQKHYAVLQKLTKGSGVKWSNPKSIATSILDTIGAILLFSLIPS